MCSNLGATSLVESTGSSSFSVKSTNALISGTEQIKLNFILDRSGTTNDYEYRWHNHYGKLLFTQIKDSSDRGIYGIDDDTGCVTLAGGRYSDSTASTTDLMRQWTGTPTDLSLQVLGRAAFRSGVRLPVNVTPGSATASGVQGDVNIDASNIWIRGASEWQKCPLQSFGAAASTGPQVYYHDHTSGNIGAQATTSNWFQLPDNTDIEIHVGGTGGYSELNRYLYRLPLNPIQGQKIKVYNAAQYVAFSNINNSISYIYVKNNSATAPHQLWSGAGGVAGNMAMRLDGHSAEIVMRIRSYINQWTMHSTSASIVARTTL
jgi:hypothetical protein